MEGELRQLWRSSAWWTALLLSSVGCHQREPAPYPVYGHSKGGPVSLAANAYTGYVEAAQLIEARAASDPKVSLLLTRVTFYPKQKAEAAALVAPSLSLIRRVTAKPCEIPFVARGPFAASPHYGPWVLIGKVLQWRVKAAADAGDYGTAIDDVITGSKFGFDLTGGNADDASLGFGLVDQLRRTIAPAMPRMSAAQLRELSAGLKRAFLARPPLERTIANEHEEMLRAVQSVQDAYRAEDYRDLQRALGDDAKDPVEYLKSLHGADDAKRVAFFAGFAKEADEEAGKVSAWAKEPTSARKAVVRPKGERPWKRLAKHFFNSGTALLAISDRACARTQLAILDAEILRLVKLNHAAPKSLAMFSPALTIDPYSGQQFGYHVEGQEYRLYSVGPDLVDNGGETDETFSRPDLTLERQN